MTSMLTLFFFYLAHINSVPNFYYALTLHYWPPTHPHRLEPSHCLPLQVGPQLHFTARPKSIKTLKST